MGQQELEQKLKSILEMLIKTIKPKFKTKSQLAKLQEILVDYQNNEQLSDIIISIVKINHTLFDQFLKASEGKSGQQDSSAVDQGEYQKLEMCLQMYQKRQRNYIKNENQLKLYCEELEIKIKELEASKNELVISTKKVILDLKRDNQDLCSEIKNLKNGKQFRQEKNNEIQNTSIRKSNTNLESVQKITKKLVKNHDKLQSSLKNKLEQYQEVIDSIEAGRGRKGSINQLKDRIPVIGKQNLS